MKKVGFVYAERFLDHAPPTGHPERPDRLRAIVRHVRESGMWDQLVHLTPTPATEEQVLSVHTREHLSLIRKTCEAGGGILDEGDTHAVAASFEVAMLAVGAASTAVDAVLGGQVSSAFAAVRPPGHHAERDRPMGFCLFNNVAVAARHAQHAHGVDRVAILDWDVHHGNGTQHIFEEDPSVFYISLHQYPFYPGTGARNETGKGGGEGFTLNIPLPAGTGEAEYAQAFDAEIVPALKRYAPGLLIISAGFDAHKDDPLGGMRLTETSVALFTRVLAGIAPVVSVLEGGYNLEALGRSVVRHLEILISG